VKFTDDILFVLAGVVIVEKSEEFIEADGDFAFELCGFGGAPSRE
jgi:hypothetical protein